MLIYTYSKVKNCSISKYKNGRIFQYMLVNVRYVLVVVYTLIYELCNAIYCLMLLLVDYVTDIILTQGFMCACTVSYKGNRWEFS